MSDMSIDLRDVEVEQPKIRNIDEDASLEESPEYAEDIDNYLRKMEVRICSQIFANLNIQIFTRLKYH